jgi:hypothetical protein
MRYGDLREGVEVFGRSLGRVMCVICVCAPAVIANHIIKDSTSDWDILVFWGGVGISIFFSALLLLCLENKRGICVNLSK